VNSVIGLCVGGRVSEHNPAGGRNETWRPGSDHGRCSARVGLVQARSVRPETCGDRLPLPGASWRPGCRRGTDWLWGEVAGLVCLQSSHVYRGVESHSEARGRPQSTPVLQLAPVGCKTWSGGTLFWLCKHLNRSCRLLCCIRDGQAMRVAVWHTVDYWSAVHKYSFVYGVTFLWKSLFTPVFWGIVSLIIITVLLEQPPCFQNISSYILPAQKIKLKAAAYTEACTANCLVSGSCFDCVNLWAKVVGLCTRSSYWNFSVTVCAGMAYWHLFQAAGKFCEGMRPIRRVVASFCFQKKHCSAVYKTIFVVHDDFLWKRLLHLVTSQVYFSHH